MIITGMDHFQSVCKKKLVEWYNSNAATQIRSEQCIYRMDLQDSAEL